MKKLFLSCLIIAFASGVSFPVLPIVLSGLPAIVSGYFKQKNMKKSEMALDGASFLIGFLTYCEPFGPKNLELAIVKGEDGLGFRLLNGGCKLAIDRGLYYGFKNVSKYIIGRIGNRPKS